MASTPRSDQQTTRSRKTKPRPRTPDRERSLDRTIESTFPASDAPSSIPDPEPKLPRNDDEHEKEALP
jgi:hypothetical protein